MQHKFVVTPYLLAKPRNFTMAHSENTLAAQAADPYEMFNTVLHIFQHSQELLLRQLQKRPEILDGKLPEINLDPLNIHEALQQLAMQFVVDPKKVINAQIGWWTDYWKLCGNVALQMQGKEVKPLIQADKSDRRFKHEAWEDQAMFQFIKQWYLMNARWLQNTLRQADLESIDARNAKKVDFYTRQLIDALAPTNFWMTNPEVLYVTVESGGKNLLKGLSNFLEDLNRGKGQLNIKMTDLDAFKPGENIAVTKGKVVFQNDLMQLIQYTPSTGEVYSKPLLIVPPWINKFYILDLREKNSYIKWAVDQGHSVFVISWINPDSNLAHKGFENYMLEGPLAALDAIEQATGEKEVNAVGYCLGGTLLASTLAYMAAKKDERIKSATFFTTLLDFSNSGELDVFIDEAQIKSIEDKMSEKGYLNGSDMATTFTMLRANDLVWSFHVNNYLMGKEASAFDLLYWNSDSTRMPAKMHSFYLRNMYQNNRLKDPNGITLNGVGIDLRNVKVPVYFISAIEDHIAPWKGTYLGSQLFSGDVKFVLGGSGHIAGIINPPAANKYFYYTNPTVKGVADSDAWLKGATQQAGSWWNDWSGWVGKFAGEKIAARVPGAGKLPALEDAPGSYVKKRALVD
jgi:polyhydroxyalkanoate synthase